MRAKPLILMAFFWTGAASLGGFGEVRPATALQLPAPPPLPSLPRLPAPPPLPRLPAPPPLPGLPVVHESRVRVTYHHHHRRHHRHHYRHHRRHHHRRHAG